MFPLGREAPNRPLCTDFVVICPKEPRRLAKFEGNVCIWLIITVLPVGVLDLDSGKGVGVRRGALPMADVLPEFLSS